MAGRRALVVGIDYYEHASRLYGCARDAISVSQVLKHHGDSVGSLNFQIPDLLTASNGLQAVSVAKLRSAVKELFTHEPYEVALFYFAGHGHLDSTGGFLLGSDSKSGDDGVSLNDILTLANQSKSTNRVIVLDSCHSGIAGVLPLSGVTAIEDGVTILTASTAQQYATEENGAGVFTGLFVDALRGGASDILGNVTPGSTYAHIDQSLGVKSQRPTFKTNTRAFVSLRRVEPKIGLPELRRITEIFPEPEYVKKLNPTYEPYRSSDEKALPAPHEENVVIFGILQKLNRTNLVVPVDADAMYWAAMNSKSCRLTPLGKHYHRLVANDLI
ncbi:MAG: caspase family protein [Planctomycetaceae bacterium]